mmetsp:Transcript_3829/g.3971  ORF Transcript_3829/g.3971 Transcript_3829/m.3971 type:complete len:127 (-) Transcript_3829:16-396(-)
MRLSENSNLQAGVIGGLIVGAASTNMLYWTGRMNGVSGIIERILIAEPHEQTMWSISYLSGSLSSGVILAQVYPHAFGVMGSAQQLLTLTPAAIAGAGFWTGFGTRLGSGCTSGHGICGLPRRSVR